MPKCEICGREFEYKNYVVTKYCSRSCAAKARHKKTYTKQCEFPGCNNTFIGSVNTKYCDAIHYVHCPVCNKKVVAKDNNPNPICCSNECRNIKETQTKREKYAVSPSMTEEARAKRRETMLERYGATDTYSSKQLVEKVQNTMQERYGVSYTLQSADLRQKVKATNMEVYGYPSATQSEIIKQRIRDTNLERYGESNPMKVDTIKNKAISNRIEIYGAHITDEMKAKARQTWLSTLNVDNPAKSKEIKERMVDIWRANLSEDNPMQSPEVKQRVMETNIERYGVPYYVMTEDCMSKNGHRISHVNSLFSDMLDSMNIRHSLEFSIGRKQYDICIPNSKILIEVDPTYTHNSFGNHWNTNGLSKMYHKEKSDVAKVNGYRCIHVFDWDDWSKIIELVQPTQRIYARNCKIVKFTECEVNAFLNRYHLQGTCKGQKEAIGLVYLDKLVQVMTFGKPRYNKNYDWELLRLCSASNVQVVGGSARIFKHFIDEHPDVSIISYCDLSKFNGDVYEKLGMDLLRITPPQEIWSKGTKKITANLLRQRGYDQLFNTDFGKGTSNESLMLNDGWLPVYDCGQSVYEYKSN